MSNEITARFAKPDASFGDAMDRAVECIEEADSFMVIALRPGARRHMGFGDHDDLVAALRTTLAELEQGIARQH